MPLPVITKPRYPDVPKAPGVPPLQRAFGVVNAISLIAADVQLLLNAFAGPRWGIFTTSGKPWLIGDSVVGVDLKRDYRLADYPVEKGGFATYNKVATPYDARLSFTVGGTDADRAGFLALVEQMAGSLDLYSVVMPEFTYPRMNVAHYDLSRTAKTGATLLRVDVWLQEVRTSATSAFTSTATQAPSGTSPVDGGNVQPATPTPDQVTAAAEGAR